MRIALVHSFYASKSPSGENLAVLDQYNALCRAGFDVALFSAETDVEAEQSTYQIRSALRMTTGRGRNPRREINDFSPDIIHVHNLTPNFSSSWLKQKSAPVVATLHNFRTVCANGLLFRDGKSCDECVDNGSSRAILHACYRGSRLQTIPIAIGNRGGAAGSTLVSSAEALVVLSEAARDRFVDFGVSQRQIHVIPNGFNAAQPGIEDRQQRNGWLFVGRLSAEKGLRELLEIWPPNESLTVVGDGPEGQVLRTTTGRNVSWQGAISRESVSVLMRQHEGLVFPSRCFEMQPTVISEALAGGLPILCFEGTSPAKGLESLGVGFRYWDGMSLQASMFKLRSLGQGLNETCESVFRNRYSEDAWIHRISKLYSETLQYRSDQ